MKGIWKSLISIGCIVALLMTVPGITVLADELDNIQVAKEAEDALVEQDMSSATLLPSTSEDLPYDKDDIENTEDNSMDQSMNPTDSVNEMDLPSSINDEGACKYSDQSETEMRDEVGESIIVEELESDSITDSLGEGLVDFLYPNLSEDVQLANDMVQSEELVGSINDSAGNAFITEEMLLQTYNFDLAKYRADLLCEHYDETITTYMAIRNPSDILVENLKKNAGFMADVEAWQSINAIFEPASVNEKVVLNQEKYYELILLNALDQQLNDSSFIEDVTSNVSQNYYEVASSILNALGVNYKCVISNETDFKKYMGILNTKASETKLNKLTTKERTKILKQLETRVEGFEKVSNYMGIISSLLSVCESVYDLAQKCAALEQIAWLEVDLCSAMNELYLQCPKDNPLLLEAIKEVKKSCENISDANIKNVFLDTTVTVANEIFKVSMGAVWDGILASCSDGYFVYFLAGQKVGKFISNYFFSTDELIESFYKMKSYCEVMDLINKSYYSLKDKYNEDSSTKNANALLSIVNIVFNTKEAGCDYAKEFADIIYTKGVWSTITNASKSESYTNFVSGCNSIKDNYCFVQDRLMNRDWLIYLSDEHPDIYKVITHAFAEEYEYIPVEGITLLNEAVTWQIGEPLLAVCANVIPSNANNQTIKYTSSNPSVVKIIDAYGGCKALSKGNAVITAVTEEGGFEIKLSVTVVDNKQSAETDVLNQGQSFTVGNFTYTVQEDGTVSVKSSLNDSQRTKVTNVSIPERVSYKDHSYVVSVIEKFGFDYFKNVKSIRIPSTVKKIRYKAFIYCYSLETINLDNIVEIGYEAFEFCNSLKKVNLGSVQNLREACFRCCYSLNSIVFNRTCYLEDAVFQDCDKLVSVNGSDMINSIGKNAFENAGIDKYVFSPNIKQVGENAFLNCQNLNEIVLPETYIPIELSVFVGSAWYEKQNDGIVYLQNFLLGYKGDIEKLTNLTINENTKYIAVGAMRNAVNLKTITFSSKIICIGSLAFKGCKKLKELLLPENLKSIHISAFQDCSGLVKVTYTSCDFSEEGAYYGCTSFKEMVIDCSVVDEIDLPSIYDGPGLTLSFSNKVEKITGNYREYNAIKVIKIGTNVKSIKDRAFSDCRVCSTVEYNAKECDTTYNYFPASIEKAVIGSSVKKIPANLFCGSEKLQEITFKKADNLYYIGSDAFAETLWIQNKLKNFVGAYYIGNCLYKYCGIYPSEKIIIAEGTVMICKDAFREQNYAKSVSFPESLKYIGESAFSESFGDNYISLDMSKTNIKIIEKYAFYRNHFSQVIFSDCIESIGNYAFGGYGLQYISIPDTVRVFSMTSFLNFNRYSSSNQEANYAIYVPDSVKKINEDYYMPLKNTRMFCKINGSVGELLKEKGFSNIFYIQEEFPEFVMDRDRTCIYDYLGKNSVLRLPEFITKIEASAFRKTTYASTIKDCPNLDMIQDFAITNEGQMTNVFSYLDHVVILRFGEKVKKMKSNFTNQFKGLIRIVFEGDCPEDIETILDSGKYHIYIPKNNSSWDKIKKKYPNVVWHDCAMASVAPISISKASVEGIDTYEYIGKEVKPEITVKVDGVILNPDRDYKVSYKNNIGVGTATVTVTGIGNYYGTATETFRIVPGSTPVKIDISNASVAGVSLSYGYSCKEYKPNITVKVDGVTLTNETDYTVKYANNNMPGTATITITGKGKYTGTRIKTFEIVDCVSSLVSGKTYQLIPKNNSKTAVCSYSGKMVNNTKVYITDRSSSEAMKFKAVKNTDGTWKFINAKCELALAVQQNSSEVGKGTVLYDQTTKKAQNWKLSKKSDNSFAIMNAVTGYSIAMSDASAVKGTTLSMAKTESTGLQRFYIAETSEVKAPYDGTYGVKASKDKKFALNVASSSKVDGANVNLYSYSNVNAKKFKVMYSGGGYYRLVNVNSGLCLTVKGNTKTDGANVIQSKWAADSGQRWKIMRNSDGTVTITNALGTVLHLNGNKTANGTNVLAKKAASTKAQRWYLN